MLHLIVTMSFPAITHILCFAVMIERKYSKKITALVYGLYYLVFVCSAVLFLTFGTSPLYVAAGSLISATVVSFFVFMFASADPVCKKIFLCISYVNVFCILQGMASIICSIWLPHLSTIGDMYAKNITRTLLYIPTVWIYIKYLRPVVQGISGNKKKPWYSIFCVSTLFYAVFAVFVTVSYADYSNFIHYVPLFVVAVVMYSSVLWVTFGTIRYMDEENKMELVSQNIEYLQGQLALARENELQAKTVRHDYRHHNQNLSAMLRKGDVQAALHYIEQYNGHLDEVKTAEFCPHITVNAILNTFHLKAQNNGIAVSIFADTPADALIADMDFVAILSNVLENAVNGCKECGRRGEITVHIRTVADKTVIVCRNPCKPELEIENNMIKHKGIGIDSILSSAKKYNGDVSYELEDGMLTVCIILKP